MLIRRTQCRHLFTSCTCLTIELIHIGNKCTKCKLTKHAEIILGARHEFSVGGAKIGEKQSRQSNLEYNFMQHVFFENRHTQYTVYKGVFENFCVTVCNVTVIKYRKNWGNRMY